MEFLYKKEKNGYTVVGFSGEAAEEICIPEEFEGTAVAKIGAGAFYGRPEIKRAVVPKTVKSIDSYAFSKCENLSEIIFFEGLKEIGEGAFLGCGGIKKFRFQTALKK